MLARSQDTLFGPIGSFQSEDDQNGRERPHSRADEQVLGNTGPRFVGRSTSDRRYVRTHGYKFVFLAAVTLFPESLSAHAEGRSGGATAPVSGERASDHGSPSAPLPSIARTTSRRSTAPGALAPFNQDELRLLEEGQSVRRSFDIVRGERAYPAGLAYRLVHATPMDVMRALRRPGGIRKSIPYGIEARVVSEADGYAQMRILQGKKPIVGQYTVRVEWDMSEYTARFWLDPGYEHDIVDIWGAFSAQEVRPGWSLVSFRFAFHIGGVGEILNNKAQRWALSTADRMARVVEESLASE